MNQKTQMKVMGKVQQAVEEILQTTEMVTGAPILAVEEIKMVMGAPIQVVEKIQTMEVVEGAPIQVVEEM
jgi:hypothetical protein